MRRVPGWVIGLGVLGWLVATVACAGSVFVGTRGFVIDAGDAIPLPQFNLDRPTAVAAEPTSPPLTEPTNTPDATDNAVDTITPTAVPQISETADELPPQDDNALVRGAASRLGPRWITVLLLGIDQRSAVESAQTEYFRTDTMILLRLDPARRTAGMLSIPRDLYVDIPGFRPARINTANSLGDANAYPGGGPALAMATVESLIGEPIDYYVLVNFDVFTTVVNTIAPNGVEVCVQEAIYDPTYPDEGYGVIEVRFEPGCQQLDAERLLQFARTRATQGADFDRARRQQQTLTAIQDHVVSTGGLVNLVARAPVLWDQLNDNLRTDMDFQTALDVALIATTINRENIQTGVIDNLYVTFDVDENGQQILLPTRSSIAALVQDTFNSAGDLTLEELRERAAQEEASIIVLNDTTTQGLAGRVQDFLAGRGVSATTGNAQNPTNGNTVIRDYTGNPWTARYLAAVLGISRDRILAGTDGQTSQDIAVFVGEDAAEILGGGQ